MALAVEQIVAAAIELLNDVGLEGLTTRRLALALDVRGPSLYHHLRNKSELLGHMAAEMLRRSLVDLDAEVPWDEWLRNLAHATRRMALAYRDGAWILASSSPTDAMRLAMVPSITRPLLDAGVPEEIANQAIGALASFVIGWSMNEQNSVMRDFMRSVMEVDRGFVFGVDAIILAVRAQLPPG